MKGWQIGTAEIHWLPQPEGDTAGLMNRFANEFNYEEVLGRLELNKASCLEVLDEYVDEKGVAREPLIEWLDSLPWEAYGEDDEDLSVGLVVAWDSGSGALNERFIVISSQTDVGEGDDDG